MDRAPAALDHPDPVAASFAVVPPEEPVPVRLMNTIWADRHGVHDALTTPDDLDTWLAVIRPETRGSESGPDDLARFRSLRDALRRLATLLTSDTRPAAASAITEVDNAVEVVNDTTRHATTWPQIAFRDGSLQGTTGGLGTPDERALSAIAQDAIHLFTSDGQGRLRACYAPGCVLYFVKQHPRREWCSVACGNRARAARHYQRHHKDGPAR